MSAKRVENLLLLIYQGQGKMTVKDGALWVWPPTIAKKLAPQIKELKSEILLSLGHCPVCAAELMVRVEESFDHKTGRHAWCPTAGHYDVWKF